MNEVPWWALSPSPFTLAFWTILTIYTASKMRRTAIRDWMRNIGSSAFALGLIVLPFDALWCIFQGAKFQSLYPSDLSWFYSLLRDLTLIFLCWFETHKMFKPKGPLRKIKLLNLMWYIPFFIVWFTLAPDPAWTDWTFGIRMGYPGSQIILAFIISHILGKAIQALIYIQLWRKT